MLYCDAILKTFILVEFLFLIDMYQSFLYVKENIEKL